MYCLQSYNVGCCQVLGSQSERLLNDPAAGTGAANWPVGLGQSHGGSA